MSLVRLDLSFLALWGHTIASFENVREYLIRQLANLLNIQVEGLEVWDIWLAVHGRCPEAARIASDQWTKKDLLEEHLRNIRFLHHHNYDHTSIEHLHDEIYTHRWNSLQAQMQQAIAKQKWDVSTYR